MKKQKALKKAVKVVKKTVAKKSNKVLHIAEALAGMTLLATMAGYSLLMVKHNKKVDFKKMKVNMMNGMNKAKGEMSKDAKMAQKLAEKMLAEKMKEMKKMKR